MSEKVEFFEAVDLVKNRTRDILPMILSKAKRKVNDEVSYVCPFCGHGKGGDGLTIYGSTNNLVCFGCGYGLGEGHGKDIIDLYGDIHHLDFKQSLKSLCEMLDIEMYYNFAINSKEVEEHAVEVQRNSYAEAIKNYEVEKGKYKAETEKQGQIASEYYEKCAAQIESPAAAAYLKKRGISMELAKFYHLGYDPAADPANAPYGQGQALYPVPRIIVPVTDNYYVARAIDDNIAPQYKKMIPKGGQAALWSVPKAFFSGADVYVVEGVFDALAILEANGNRDWVVALNSTSNYSLVAKAVEDCAGGCNFIISLDNDYAGQSTTEKLIEDLKVNEWTKKWKFKAINLAGAYKDCNEALVKDREGFTDRVSLAYSLLDSPDSVSSYLYHGGFKHDIEQQAAPIPTGFTQLDKLSGGLQAGLYFLAAISSLGKTTFASQLADNVAAASKRVLYFSLEQSKAELVSKSLARQIALYNPLSNISSMSIRRGFNQFDAAQAIQDYIHNVGFGLTIIEAGSGQCIDSNFIKTEVDKYNPDVVIIDYLQIMDSRLNATAREKIDRNVLDLKRLSRDKGITVFVISSINRNAYLSPIDFESFKESGGIEFSADVVYGLQLQALSSELLFQNDKDVVKKRERIKQAKLEVPRKLELVCLKNRFGQTAFSVNFEYNPVQELFTEAKTNWDKFGTLIDSIR